MDDHFEQVAEAFTRKALEYDAFGQDHPNLARMRRKVYDHISDLVPPGGRLLELNAGTGLDAVAMVQRGYSVHATDLAPGMVAEIERKVACYGLRSRLTAQQCSFTELDQVQAEPFDGIYSNSGGLNCIDDLTAVTRHLPRLLRPGGIVTCTVMPPVCPWELLRILKDLRVATRRLRRNGVIANVAGVSFKTYYFTPRQVRRAFGTDFRQVRLEGLSVVTPPADNKSFPHRFPRLYHRLVQIDDQLCRWPPFNGWGDFFILSLVFNTTTRL